MPEILVLTGLITIISVLYIKSLSDYFSNFDYIVSFIVLALLVTYFSI